jgi:hypothetical protein
VLLVQIAMDNTDATLRSILYSEHKEGVKIYTSLLKEKIIQQWANCAKYRSELT